MTTTTNPLQSAVDFLDTHVPDRSTPLLVAVSGGADSMALLHLVDALGYGVHVAHLHHGLREQADHDQRFVQDVCKARNLPCHIESVDVAALAKEAGKGLEEAGRHARYAFFRRCAHAHHCTWILTAHHGDDNAETLLLHLVRGTGVAGLQGIAPVSENLLRPLLGVTRQDIDAYVSAHGLAFVQDHTNQDTRFARNFIRHEVMPLLQSLNPRLSQAMGRTATLVRQEHQALLALLPAPTPTPGGYRFTWCALDALGTLSGEAVRQGLCPLLPHGHALGARHVSAILALGRTDTLLQLPHGVVAIAERHHLRLVRLPTPEETPLSPGQTLSWGLWDITVPPTIDTTLCVTPWRPSDRLPHTRGERSVKRLLHDAPLSALARHTAPVIRRGESIVAVGGLSTSSTITLTYKGDIDYDKK